MRPPVITVSTPAACAGVTAVNAPTANDTSVATNLDAVVKQDFCSGFLLIVCLMGLSGLSKFSLGS